MRNLVMLLTYFRVISGPIIFLLSVFLELYFFSFLLFVFSAITDFLDGFLARKFNATSSFGAFLDPVADKLLLCSAIISIILITNDYFIGLIGMFLLLREYWVAGLREYNALNNIQSASKVSYLAKVKTSIQFISISSFYLSFSYNLSLGIFLSSFLLFLSLLISLKTGMEYTSNTLRLK
tara:strand:- start:599 stop:1138 length:540 start_codon:yes stop_codon:yes gene_type:complete